MSSGLKKIAVILVTLFAFAFGDGVFAAAMSVRNLMQSAPTNEYASLNEAIAAAGDDDILEVFASTRLTDSVVVGRNLTIRSADVFADEPTNCAIRCSRSAVFTVECGARVEFRGLAFDSGADPLINVRAGGTAALAGRLSKVTVHTVDADGFEICGELDFVRPFDVKVTCDVANTEGAVFGRWTCADGGLACASRVLCSSDLDLGGVAVEDGSLVWGLVSADPRYAVAYVDDGSSVPFLHRTLDGLFRRNPTGDLEVRLLRDVVDFSTTVDVSGRRIGIKSDNDVRTITVSLSKRDGFLVGAGGELSFEKLVCAGECACLVRLPENGGVFTLGRGAVLRRITAVGVSGRKNGLVCQLGGKTVVTSGARIEDCAYQNGVGSVLMLYGGELDIRGGSISGCSATQYAGAICVYPYPADASISISGAVEINGNVYGNKNQPGDICLATDAARISVVGEVVSDGGIGVYSLVEENNAEGAVFGGVVGALSDPAVFFNDRTVGDRRPLTASLDGVNLVWRLAEDTYGQCDPSEATVRVSVGGGIASRHYFDLADALGNLDGDATIVLDADQYLGEGVVIDRKVTIDGSGHRIVRTAPGSIRVTPTGDLSLENVTVTGYDVDRPWDFVSGTVVFRGSNKRIIDVFGGRLTLGDGAEICELGVGRALEAIDGPSGSEVTIEADGYDRASCAVVVDGGGEFVMEPGSSIHGCVNPFYGSAVNLGVTAGVLVEDSTAVLRGGRIYDCVARLGSAFDVCQGGVVYLDGDVEVAGNVNVDGDASDFMLEDLSKLYLASPFAGRIGYAPGVKADPNVVSEPIAGLSEAEVVDSARRFRNTVTGARAVAVRSGDVFLIVWSTALDGDGKYGLVDSDGTTTEWTLVGGEIPKSVASYRVAGNFVYDAKIHYALAASVGCEPFEGACGTNATEYLCRIRPQEGFAWEDGTTAVSNVVWTISAAPLTIRPRPGSRYFVEPEDQIALHEPRIGFTAETLYGKDSVETVLRGEISHENHGRNIDGRSLYAIGTLECVNGNYYIASFNPDGAYMVINGSATNVYPRVERPEYAVVTNSPVAFAFTGIVCSDEERICKVTLADLVKGAKYTVYSDTALEGGFAVGSAVPVASFNAEADGSRTLTIPTSGSAFFLKAVGETTCVTNFLDDLRED